MIAVGAAFAIVLTLGFEIRPRLADIVSDRVFGAVAAFAIVGLSFGIMRLLYRGSFFGSTFRYDAPRRRPRVEDTPERAAAIREIKAQAARDHAAYQEFRRQRVAELASDPDPVRRKYAVLVGRGESWTDAQIAYHENKSMTATCEHLVEVERAMRKAGIATRLLTTPWKELATLANIQARCRVNEAELRYRFMLAPTVHYEEGYQPERHPHDNPWAVLRCGQCRSSIDLIHPDQGPADIPWFLSEPR